jgi:hypothetical protein
MVGLLSGFCHCLSVLLHCMGLRFLEFSKMCASIFPLNVPLLLSLCFCILIHPSCYSLAWLSLCSCSSWCQNSHPSALIAHRVSGRQWGRVERRFTLSLWGFCSNPGSSHIPLQN